MHVPGALLDVRDRLDASLIAVSDLSLSLFLFLFFSSLFLFLLFFSPLLAYLLFPSSLPRLPRPPSPSHERTKCSRRMHRVPAAPPPLAFVAVVVPSDGASAVRQTITAFRYGG